MDVVLFISETDFADIEGVSKMLDGLKKDSSFLNLSCKHHQLHVWCSTIKDTTVTSFLRNNSLLCFEVKQLNADEGEKIEVYSTLPIIIFISHFKIKKYQIYTEFNYLTSSNEFCCNKLPCFQPAYWDWAGDKPLKLDNQGIWLSDIRSGGISELLSSFIEKKSEKLDTLESYLVSLIN